MLITKKKSVDINFQMKESEMIDMKWVKYHISLHIRILIETKKQKKQKKRKTKN